MDWGGTKYPGW